MTYAAHIITSEATALGDPQIIVMTDSDEVGAADEIVSYDLNPDLDPIDQLRQEGWQVTSEPTDVETGYYIHDVEPADWAAIVKAVTFCRARSEIERERQETAWRTVIRDAMNDESTVKIEIAAAADISRERAYQIRDGRR